MDSRDMLHPTIKTNLYINEIATETIDKLAGLVIGWHIKIYNFS